MKLCSRHSWEMLRSKILCHLKSSVTLFNVNVETPYKDKTMVKTTPHYSFEQTKVVLLYFFSKTERKSCIALNYKVLQVHNHDSMNMIIWWLTYCRILTWPTWHTHQVFCGWHIESGMNGIHLKTMKTICL